MVTIDFKADTVTVDVSKHSADPQSWINLEVFDATTDRYNGKIVAVEWDMRLVTVLHISGNRLTWRLRTIGEAPQKTPDAPKHTVEKHPMERPVLFPDGDPAQAWARYTGLTPLQVVRQVNDAYDRHHSDRITAAEIAEWQDPARWGNI